MLTETSRKHRQPAMAVALIEGDAVAVEAAVGTAVFGKNLPVDTESRFHIGSTTKSMTALLIATLVDDGKLRYDTTLEQALPGIPMLEVYRTATIHELLLHKAGIVAFQHSDFEDPAIFDTLWTDIPSRHPDPREQSKEAAKFALNLEPIAKPGEKAVYSNVGYAIAGLIAEEAAHRSYEDLLRERVFKPLGMKDARVGGWPASDEEPEQPRGHYPAASRREKAKPQPLNDEYTFPSWMNPSGGVHCSIVDYALYARENLQGLQGKGKLLSQEGYRTIHRMHATAKLSEMYVNAKGNRTLTLGYGWVVTQVKGYPLSGADGSGGTFYARLLVYPAFDVAFAGFTNCGDGSRALAEAFERSTGLKW